MATSLLKVTVLFENPFWIGLVEIESNSTIEFKNSNKHKSSNEHISSNEHKCSYEVCKITFGAEPKDYDVYDFLLKNFTKLRFSPSIQSTIKQEKNINPKRMQRLIKKQLSIVQVGTKAQQALKLQQEQGKQERKVQNRKQIEEEKQRQLELKQQKHKEKHRGH